MELTLNQIVARIKALALGHRQVKNFYFGTESDFDIKGGEGDVMYPAIFLNYNSSTIDHLTKLDYFNFSLYVVSLVNISESAKENETDVLSDTKSIIKDITALLQSYNYQYDWEVDTNIPVEVIREGLGDMVGGHSMTFNIGVEYLADVCQVPADIIDFEDIISPIMQTRILTYTGTGLEGDSFEVPDLLGKKIIATYRAGYYKRPVTTAITDTELLRIIGTQGLGQVTSTTGFVELITGDALINGEKLDFIYYG